MFENATEILRSWLTTSKRTEIHDVLVTYNGASSSAWSDWESILREWLPRFEQAGWLDGLNGIHIENERLQNGNCGQYDWLFRKIVLSPRPYLSKGYSVSSSREEVLVHEMAHHAHRREIGVFVPSEAETVFPKYQRDFERHVSPYAGTDMYEAVAEMATGSVQGEEYPSRLHRAYDEFGGPKGISALRGANESEDL